MFGGNFAPVAWAPCDGRLLPISQYDALFSLLGTTYGGDGETTFALPDMRGRVPLHNGSNNYPVSGMTGGSETVTLAAGQMPFHSHLLGASSATPAAVPAGGLDLSVTPMVPASPLPKPKMYADTATPVAMSPGAVLAAGGSQPHLNLAPSMAVTFIIALEGIYPSQS